MCDVAVMKRGNIERTNDVAIKSKENIKKSDVL